MRVTAQLIDTESGNYLWSEAYDRQLENVLAIQEEMARAIVDTLQLTLAWRSGAASRKAPDLKCYNLCLQGRFHANKRTPDGLRQSVLCFEQAVAADDSSAEAYAGLADAYSLMADYSTADPKDVVPKARLGRGNGPALRSTIFGGSRLAGVYSFHIRMGLGRGRFTLSAGDRSQPRLLSRASLVQHRLSGASRRVRRSAAEKPRSRVIWTRYRRSSWKDWVTST